MNQAQIDKLTPCQKREAVIEIARTYTKDNIDYMSKNSKYTTQSVIDKVCALHISNDVIRNSFRITTKRYIK